jgi:ABC-type uncharacterized transport system substrate-binding protein
MAKEILEGTSPANIPFRYVTKSSLKVNTEAMEYFNIQLPEKYTQKE